MSAIQLNRGYEAIVDAEDVALVAQFNWTVLETGGLCYARRTIRIGQRQKTILLHRVIMKAKDGEFVDHINGNGLDCRKENMRIVTKSQNNINRKARPNRLGVPGVRKHSLCNKYTSDICVGNKRKYLGLFETIEEASAAYQNAAEMYHGEFRRKA